MASRTGNNRKPLKSNGANLGFEEKMWQAADKLRGYMDPSEYKDVVLGLVFLKYISDAFQERYQQLGLFTADPASDYFMKEPRARYEVLEDRDEYRAENIFWVPKEARWPHLQANARQPIIGKRIDDAMDAIERENNSLKGVLSKNYARPTLDKQRLGELVDLIGTIGLGDKESRSKDILGRVYEYFLSKFASAEGKKGGEVLYSALYRAVAGGNDRDPSKGGFMTPAVVRRECLSRARSSSNSTGDTSVILRFTVRSPIPPPGAWRR